MYNVLKQGIDKNVVVKLIITTSTRKKTKNRKKKFNFNFNSKLNVVITYYLLEISITIFIL